MSNDSWLANRRRFFLRQALSVAAGFTTFLASLSLAGAEQVTTINPGQTWEQWEGWGTSLCWWAKAFGDRDDLADALFTLRTTEVEGRSVPGLGLNFARYNAGACSPNDVAGQKMAVSPKKRTERQITGFWRDGQNADPASKSWDWSADASQRAMLLKARDRGANRFELFSNSPMWWMCANRNPSGDASGGDNLPAENYEKFAVYLAAIAKEAKERWGIAFTTVEPLNEPSANWWKADNNQEGCHFSHEAQAAVIRRLRAELDRRGLHDTPIAAPDENLYDQALETWTRFDPETRSMVGQINVHGYQHDKGRRDLLFQAVAAAGKRLWNTEYGDKDASGLDMARDLDLDFRFLHPAGWTYWQPLDMGGWGLIRADLSRKIIQDINPKYYVLAQYSRHIRPGVTILDTGEADAVAAYDAGARKLVLVALNRKTAGDARIFDLSKFAQAEGPVTCWTTEPRGSVRYEMRRGIPLTQKRLAVVLPAESIQTFEVENVAGLLK